MSFGPNDSPLAGQEGDKVTSRVIRERLRREAEGNVALRVSDTDDKTVFEVAGRGELQLGVLVETMRREGYELSLGRPRVLYREDPDSGVVCEPYEEVVVDVDDDYAGIVIDKLAQRRGRVMGMHSSGGGKTRIVFHAPSRGLIGYHGEFLTDTRGTGVMHRVFHDWEPVVGEMAGRRCGTMVSMEQGRSVAYALWNLEERGPLFIGPGERVYGGMIIGEHNKGSDLEVNPLKGKQLTNMRASGKDDAIQLTPPTRMTVEQAMSYIADDELVELILAGSQEHFDMLYNAYFPRVYQFARKRLRDRSEAEDVAQDVFMTLLHALPSYRGQSSLLVWIFGITRNKVNRSFRKQRPQLSPMDSDSVMDVEGSEPFLDDAIEARRLLGRCQEIVSKDLSETQRRIFDRKHMRRESIRAIAQALGKSEDAIKANLYRIRCSIRDSLPGIEVLLRS